MKILVDISHPAHVHFFKHAARVWQEHGQAVKFVARNKEITFQLLNEYGIPYQGLSKMRKGLGGLAVEMVEHQAKLARVAREFKPDVMLNIGGTFIAHVGKLMGIQTVIFTDTESARLSNRITFPFATWICTPSAYLYDLGKKQVRYQGFHELAYLHPNRFTPDLRALQESGLAVDEPYFLLRFVSWGASHDVGQAGLTSVDKITLVNGLLDHGKVLITSESPLPPALEPYKVQISPTKIHDLLAFARMYVGEGTTMASEAAMLGVPSIYINTRVDGYVNELSSKYELIHHFQQSQPAVEKAIQLAGVTELLAVQQQKRQRMLADKIDVTAWMVEFIETITSKKG
jgi:hypothetical protein